MIDPAIFLALRGIEVLVVLVVLILAVRRRVGRSTATAGAPSPRTIHNSAVPPGEAP